MGNKDTAEPQAGMTDVQRAALFGGPILALFSGGLMFSVFAWTPEAATTLGVTLLCVSWWIFEPIPIPATSLLPLALLPLFGVVTADEVAQSYGHPLVLLLLGGFLLSTALAKSGAHRRLALAMVRAVGGGSSRSLVLGFMVAAAVLSMWISNTATTLMLLPVALAVVERSDDPALATPLLLGIAYAASVGGIGTPIGTPPNVVFMGVYSNTFGEELTFTDWMKMGVPVVLLMVPVIWLWLTRGLRYKGHVDLPRTGRWSTAEKRVMIVFACTAIAWVTRKEPFGGWTAWLGLPYSNDAIVAFIGVVALFLVPDGKGARLLDWDTANAIPWGVLILFGAGICIAGAFTSSGLSNTIGEGLAGLATLPTLAMIACICLAVTFLTEATSNTATTTLLMPILATAAVAAAMDPKLFMVPAAMSASCAFMLPVATAPNAVMFSTGRFTTTRMAREGFALNLAGTMVITFCCYLIIA
jgi:sodium-dependent dicarboxylate transporter 2/3/5